MPELQDSPREQMFKRRLRALQESLRAQEVGHRERLQRLHQRVRANKISRAEERKFWRERHDLATQQLQEEFHEL